MKVLYLEDNSDDAGLVLNELRRVFPRAEVAITDEEDVYRSHLEDGVDLILCDFKLPGYSGIEAFQAAFEICPNVPFIYITGTLQCVDHAEETFLRGATGYVLKNNLAGLYPLLIDVKLSRLSGHMSFAQTVKTLTSSIQLIMDLKVKIDDELGQDGSAGNLEKAVPRLLVLRGTLDRASESAGQLIGLASDLNSSGTNHEEN